MVDNIFWIDPPQVCVVHSSPFPGSNMGYWLDNRQQWLHNSCMGMSMDSRASVWSMKVYMLLD